MALINLTSTTGLLETDWDQIVLLIDGEDTGDLTANTAHRTSDGSSHADVVTNSAKVSYPGSADAAELNILDGATLTTTELNYVDGVTSSVQDQLDAKSDLDVSLLSKSSTYEVAAADAGKVIECDGTFTVTFPDSLDTGFTIIVVNVGTGTITIAAGTTLHTKGSAVTLPNQYGAATAYHSGSDVWTAFGDLE